MSVQQPSFRLVRPQIIIKGVESRDVTENRTVAAVARIVCCLLAAALCAGAAVSVAQEPAAGDAGAQPAPQPGPGEPSPSKSAAEKPARAPEGFDIRYLPGPDGRAVPVPDKASLEDYLRWLAEKGQAQGPPAVSITSLSFDGIAEEERVQLMAHVELRVTSDRWEKVPLQMAEATLRDAWTHTGDGQAVAALEHPEEGYSWWIKGQGRHELLLPLSIPLRKQGAQRRVQLSVPETAVSQLKLRVASPRVQAKVPERSTLSMSTAGRETQLEVVGLGKRLDVQWLQLAEATSAEAPLEVATSVIATLVDGENAMLEATQLIKSLGHQGTFDEVRVSLPSGYELLRLDGPEHRDHRIDPANPHRVVVQLKKATSGPVELKWAVRVPASGDLFTLEGFEVERARLQTGYVAVVVVGDVRMIRQPDGDKFLQPIDLADLPGAMRQVPASAAYRFLNRMLLRVKLQRIEPYVTVDPALLLHLSNDAIDLEAAYRLQVLRGKIDGLRLRWPHRKEQGWVIEEAELPGHVELRPVEDAADPDLVRLEFAEPAKGTLDLRLRARRPLASPTEGLPVSLPVPEAYAGLSTPLAVISDDNVEADVRPAPKTLLPPVGDRDAKIRVPRDWQPLKRHDYRIESRESELLVGLAVHPPRVLATTEAEASIRSGVVTVRQKLQFDVAYERLATLRFAILEGIPAEQLKFVENGRELVAGIAPATGKQPAELQVALDGPGIGRFEVEARYAFPVKADPDAQTTLIAVPLLQSLDALFSSTRFSCRDAAGREALVDEEGWQRQLAADGLPVWVLPNMRGTVPVKITHAAAAPYGGLVSKALIRSRISGDGLIVTRAQYVLAEGISELSVILPAALEARAFWWDRRELPVTPVLTTATGDARYDLVLPDHVAGGARLLTIDYLAKAWPTVRSSAVYSIETPRFPGELRSADVRWQVELPFNQHLFTEPDGFSAVYRWRPGRPFWVREPDWSTDMLERWIGPQADLSDWAESAGENRYVFSAFSPPGRLVFRAMNRSVIVLMGAGTALILGIVLVKWPAMRHVLTLLAAAFFVSLLAVYFPAPVQVLLQPAALGVALAVLMATIESFVKRRSRPVMVTLTSPSSFMSPASSHPRTPAPVAGSHDFTAIRENVESGEPAGQLSESGKPA